MSRAEPQPKRLVIVESPTKARTIRRFLPRNYRVEASMGHVRDLPASAAEIPDSVRNEAWARLGVNVDDDFEPLYVVSPRKKSVVAKLRSALQDADELYIATDEDREGESIGWHLVELLEPEVPVRRMVFHEITEDAIRRALDETREIDRHLVDAQETRRVLDRLVGYTISPLLWRKIAPKLSAGRVQSVAVRLLVLRERERLAFHSASYWDLKARLARRDAVFDASLTHLDGVRLVSGRDFDPDTGRLREGLELERDVRRLDEAAARELARRADGGRWRVAGVDERRASRSPSPPFTTSTLQQEASRKLGLSAKETMRIAQGLYENGYITYMRTDSTHLSQEAIEGSRAAVEERYGHDYLSPKPRQFSSSARNAQEAHEAIRPAGRAMRTQDELKLAGAEGALYDLIWKRTVATQMADARLKFVTATLEVRLAGPGDDELATFRASGRTTLFPGFFRAYVEGSDDPEAALDDREQPLPELTEGDPLEARDVDAVGHETKPPARFTEASLVKLLEREGIGRPSTYASIIDTVIGRGYVRKHGSQLVPTFTAFATNKLLEHQFRQLVDTEFTARMEQALDDIASGEQDAIPYLRSFFKGDDGIEGRVEQGLEGIDAREISTLRAEPWEPYVIRVGRYGPYAEGEIDGEMLTASLPEDVAPADLIRDRIEELLREGNRGDRVLGRYPGDAEDDPAAGLPMVLRSGPYGPYLQLGDDEQKGKPKRVSLPPGVEPREVTEAMASDLLSLPRPIGRHPDDDAPVEVGIGRFGPYVRHHRTYASIPKDEDVLGVGLDRALELLAKKQARNRPLRVLGTHPESGDEIELRDGRYGPYVKHGRTNASLRRDQDPDAITLDEALTLLAEREAKTGGGGKRRAKGGRKTAAKGGGTKGRARGTKKAVSKRRKKASSDDLAPFLGELEPDTAEVVRRLEGMGRSAQELADVADAVGRSEEDVRALHKKGMFKLRMAYGKARKADGAGG